MTSTPGDPRNTKAYRDTAAHILATSDLCHLCGHHGAHTADHIISIRQWLHTHGTLDGVNHPTNIAPAHGGGSPTAPNRCTQCVAAGHNGLCNQSRGARELTPQPRSRNW